MSGKTNQNTSTEVVKIPKCPLYKICKSPSKRSRGWACTKDNETREQSCAVYVAFYRGRNVRSVLDLEQKDVIIQPLG